MMHKLLNGVSLFYLLVRFWLSKATATYMRRKVGGAELITGALAHVNTCVVFAPSPRARRNPVRLLMKHLLHHLERGETPEMLH